MKEIQTETTCPLCELTKDKGEFYESCGYCKECHKQYMGELSVKKREDIIKQYIKIGLVTLEQYRAVDRLLISCQSRYNACYYNQKGYKEIECDYANYLEFFELLVKDEKFFSGWIELTERYYADDCKRSSTPVIDRIDSSGHYTLNNVQPLTHYENTKKARQKPCTAVLFKDGNLVDVFNFESKKQCNEQLQNYVPVKVLKTLDYDTPYFQSLAGGYYLKVQTDDAKIGDILKKDNPKNYKIVLQDVVHYVFDLDKKKVRVYKDDNSYELKMNGLAFTFQ